MTYIMKPGKIKFTNIILEFHVSILKVLKNSESSKGAS